MDKDVPLAFFSYSRHDQEFVLKLAKDLRAGGAAVWLDQLDIRAGEKWDTAVGKALANCPRMLLVLSPASVDSDNVMDEVSFALEKHKLVIPVLYRDCEIPFRLRRVQYIDARTEYDRSLHELLRMLGVESALGAELTIAAAAHSGAVNAAADARVEEEQAEATLIAKEREQAEAAKARREQEERERAAQEQAEAARTAKEREQAEVAKARREQEERERAAQEQAEATRIAKEGEQAEAAKARREQEEWERAAQEQAGTARTAKEREQAEAAKARREQEERERAAQEHAEAARIAKEREQAEAANARREQAAGDKATSTVRERSEAHIGQYEPAIGPPPQGSSRKLVIGGVAAVVLLGAGIGIFQMTSQSDSRTGSSESSQRLPSPTPHQSDSYPGPTPPGGRKSMAPEPAARVSTEWIRDFIKAEQGPSAEGLRLYFAEVVTPYYGFPSADWAAIEKDKTYYFSRFPTISYTLTGEPERTSVSGGEALDFNIRYENAMRGGKVVKGTSHLRLTVRFNGGVPKIVGIEERKVSE